MEGAQQAALLPVHPRVCGELGHAHRQRPHIAGSSPRVRGTRRDRLAGDGRVQVHPRVCGELLSRCWMASRMPGSSPRVRGTLACQHRQTLASRFIPACAGNSRACRRSKPRTTVHPRVCGELLDTQLPVADAWRFIPACAGNSARSGRTRCGTPVHPRVCGELSIARITSSRAAGSSPRVRGTQRSQAAGQARRRFIPACAGNSPVLAHARSSLSVHPRVCGELHHAALGVQDVAGSSPRVRGTRGDGELQRQHRRFIPACAGNSRGCVLRRRSRPVHPRVCGELR